MSNLVIVESPAKCAKIQSFLGPGFKVLASMGHIQALVKDLAVVGPQAGFEPSYEWITAKARATTAIKEAAKGAKTVYIASDADFEGNFIGYSLIKLLKLDPKTTPRLVFTEITEKAIKNAIANPTVLDMNKVQAQQARSLLDLTIGFTISPLLWKSVGPALSAGRCQIPCLRLVADKEKVIADFTSTLSWVINGTFIKKEKTKSKFKPISFSATLEDELEDEDSAQNYLENHSDETDAVVLGNTTKKTTSPPPKPLITSTLQQQASNLYRSAPAQTMRAAQKLYESGHITYMRTDHAVLSEEAVAETRAYIIGVWGEEYCSALAPSGSGPGAAQAEEKPKKKAAKKKEEAAQPEPGPKAQEAHEAIRPTHINLTALPPGEDSWSTLERNLYRLIWLRTVQSCMAAAQGEQRTVRFAFTGEEADLPWRASFSHTTFPGWKATVTKETTEDTDEQDAGTDEAQWAFSQTLTAGTPLTYTMLQAKAHLTKPASRYSEASLIQDLESKGIGRPSTYASLLETIQEKSYVEKRDTPARTVEYNTYSVIPSNSVEKAVEERKVGGEKDRLYPTALGLSVLEYCVNHFGDLFDYGFTAGMEARLDAIASGDEPWKQVLKDTWASYKDRYEELLSDKGDGKRREFQGGIVAVNTAKGPLLLKEEAAAPEAVAAEAEPKLKGKKKTSTVKAESKESKATFYGWPVGYTLQTITQEAIDAFLTQKTAETTETVVGTMNDTPIVRKKGPYGLYVQCGDLKVPWKEDDTEESLIERLGAKEGSTLRVAGDYTIKNGPYGIYMYCTKAPAKQAKGKYSKPTFVSVPKDADWKNATEAELAAMYSAGTEAKKKACAARWKAKGGKK